MAEFLAGAPPGLDAEAIVRRWQALRPPYLAEQRRPPEPLWARRGLSDDGAAAWAALEADAPGWDPGRPTCIYVHLPFCAHRCAFCDCYSFAVRAHAADHLGPYVDMLRREVDAWAGLATLPHRPISTVHLGGGTPTLLGEQDVARLVGAIRGSFAVTPHTEWALESTTSELTGGMLAALARLGFTRLHVGVQSLQDGVRRSIGRREPASTTIAKIERAVARGWVVSVDVITGLPGQDASGLAGDLALLDAAGVDGVSVYALQLSGRNRPFARRHGIDEHASIGSYLLFQVAAQVLECRGYRKTLFNHWARGRDTNLYFTFPERGEDCLALGTIADGVLGSYHYRHPEYAAYRRAIAGGGPWLQGGLRRSACEEALRPLEVSLLSGRPSAEPFAAVLGGPQATALLGRWRAARLVEPDGGAGGLILTGNGSWLAGNMLAEAMGGPGQAAATR